MTDANEISRAYIARQTAHRTGVAFEVSPAPAFNYWRLAGMALCVLPWIALAAIFWVGS